MADITDYTKTFTIALTGEEEPEVPPKTPWLLLAALAGGLYYLSRKG